MKRAVGVFDSGVGGLSVLSHIHQMLPSEDLIYVADSAYMPYGCKSSEVVTERCLKIAGFFSGQGAKAIVVACNTATAVAVQALRERCDIPVIGMEPPVKPAVSHSRTRTVGILATNGTVSSDRFNTLKSRFAADARLLVQPCPGLVERIESGDLTGDETRQMLSRYLKPLIEQGVDTLVLGCTHYPFIIPLIKQITGEGVKVIDTGDAIARELKRQLQLREALADVGESGRIAFWSSGKATAALISRLWGEKVDVGYLDI
ncbi:glutamate racemase [Mariprofundus ferrinatatus]|uniref:Glutamate racemase n=1 Tax=Mariprofundus ferrinatatus TaxID=1921087 RepID=A0A2K8L2Z4_9PROT|nr:glutamate racemase [Mariprofundus ferrinatatus]ATX81657.1 glutamate racemase [Mariprofundus ferrinatatus]